MDLLNEIECDPDFMPKREQPSETAYLSFRISKLYMEHEALLLLLRVKDVITEDEYQKAIHHIAMEAKELDELTEINSDFIKKSDEKFKEIINKGD